MKKKAVAAALIATVAIGTVLAKTINRSDSVSIDPKNTAALQDGFNTFVRYCMGCHSLQYQSYAATAQDLHLSKQQLQNTPGLAEAAQTNALKSAMSAREAQSWFGVAPPDLTLSARVRGVDWLYQYLRSFYEDPKRPNGVNNLLLPNTAMPHALLSLQGRPYLHCPPEKHQPPSTSAACQLNVIATEHALPPAEYDQKVAHLVNFLAYTADPKQAERHALGIWVILFMSVFSGFAYLIKREYWNGITATQPPAQQGTDEQAQDRDR